MGFFRKLFGFGTDGPKEEEHPQTVKPLVDEEPLYVPPKPDPEILEELNRQFNKGLIEEAEDVQATKQDEAIIKSGTSDVEATISAKKAKVEKRKVDEAALSIKRNESTILRAISDVGAIVAKEKAIAEKSNVRYSVVRMAGSKGRSVASIKYEIATMMVDRFNTFGRVLIKYVNKCCQGSARECYKRAGVSKQVYSRIISDFNHGVNKRTALQLCIGLRLSVEEANELLNAAGYSFSRSSFEDMAFLWCLKNRRYDLFALNELLASGECEPIKIA